MLEIKPPEPTPFKVRIDGSPAILVAGADSISVQFEEIQKSLVIDYSAIRCIQRLRGGTVLIDATGHGGFTKYLIWAPGSKRMYGEIGRKLQ